VPVLVDGDLAIWDTLAIAEYVAETYPEKHLWPQDKAARARARSVCAEMHSAASPHCAAPAP
jgi:glutathione S-transferase